jgi:hypothetical protein
MRAFDEPWGAPRFPAALNILGMGISVVDARKAFHVDELGVKPGIEEVNVFAVPSLWIEWVALHGVRMPDDATRPKRVRVHPFVAEVFARSFE